MKQEKSFRAPQLPRVTLGVCFGGFLLYLLNLGIPPNGLPLLLVIGICALISVWRGAKFCRLFGAIALLVVMLCGTREYSQGRKLEERRQQSLEKARSKKVGIEP